MAYRMYDLIEMKKHNIPLNEDEIRWMVGEYTAGRIPDYQISAFLMAVWFQGLSDEETSFLTMAMAESGEMMDLSAIPGTKLDKHSSGGIGDKTTLILGPVMSALGIPTAKMSGRGLGFTGGTVDKLESIPGLRSEFSLDEFLQVVKDVGFVEASQTKNLAPADKLLYALRDVTATVDSIPLIASSIMSKKIAAGADRIVLDVKCGSGAFMQELSSAKQLAETMIRIGESVGRKTVAVISDMNQPLGRAVGNAIEVEEALEVLSGGGEERLRELVIRLAVEMLQLSDKAKATEEEAREEVIRVLTDGSAKERFFRYVERTGGNTDFQNSPSWKAAYQEPVYPKEAGYLYFCNASEVGLAAVILGAGRDKKEDVIDPAAGIRILKKLGDPVTPEEPIAILLTNKKDSIPAAKEKLLAAYSISQEKPEVRPVVEEVLGK
jgi:pyrimidine-nucleoside phosphorylase